MKKVLILLIGPLLFSGCRKALSEAEIKAYQEQGKTISQEAFQKLSGTLSAKVKEGGIPEAVKFCNSAALPLTDEVAEAHGVAIKRTALRTRNQNNAPDEQELVLLNEFKEKEERGESLDPVVRLDDQGQPHYYAPILLQKQCLACHGSLGQELSPQVDSIIKSYYPDDRATGFKENDLRGMWSIAFKN